MLYVNNYTPVLTFDYFIQKGKSGRLTTGASGEGDYSLQLLFRDFEYINDTQYLLTKCTYGNRGGSGYNYPSGCIPLAIWGIKNGGQNV